MVKKVFHLRRANIKKRFVNFGSLFTTGLFKISKGPLKEKCGIQNWIPFVPIKKIVKKANTKIDHPLLELNVNGILIKLEMRRLLVTLLGIVKSVTKIVTGCLRKTNIDIFVA